MTDQRRAALRGKFDLLRRDKPPRRNEHGPALAGWPASASIVYDGPRLCVRFLDDAGRPVATVPAPEHFN